MPTDRLHRSLALAVLVGITIACWALVTPPGGGPDEVSHLVRAGGVARAQDGRDAGAETFFEVPDDYLAPDVTCWIFQPGVAASCAGPRETSGAVIEIPTRADGYPIWSHLYAGLASRLPGLTPLWWARAANGLLAAALVGGALFAVRQRPFAAASVLAAVTPMAWFSFGIVNPSSMAIAGAIALWAGLVHRPDAPWLTACGWAALALPRRDGLIWACLALAAWLLVDHRRIAEWWRSLGLGPQIVVGASTVATVVWGATADSQVSRLVATAPLLLVATELVQRLWARVGTARRGPRLATIATIAAVGVATTIVVVRNRPGGWDGDLAGRVIGETGANLVEAIGRLGWLDTPLPSPAIAAWVVIVGLLAGASLLDRAGWAIGAATILAVSIVTAWVFELAQGNTSGTYWQGRYSLPILAGVPIVLGAARFRPDTERRIASVATVGALVVVNVALVAAARRFGVGTDGSLLPWRWDTYDAPLPVLFTLVIHAAVTTALAAVLLGSGDVEASLPAAAEADRAMVAG